MKNIIALFVFFFIVTPWADAQIYMEWSAPKPLSDSISDNSNACVLGEVDYCVAVWQKTIDDSTSALCLKKIGDSSQNDRIILQNSGIRYSHPAGLALGNSKYLVAFEAADATNNKKLQYIVVDGPNATDPASVAPLHDPENGPEMQGLMMLWTDDSSVWVSELNISTLSFGTPYRLVQGGAYNLKAQWEGVFSYLNRIAANTAIVRKSAYFNNNIWQISTLDSMVIEGQLTNFDVASNAMGGSGSTAEVHGGPHDQSLIYSDALWGGYYFYHSSYVCKEPTIEGFSFMIDNFYEQLFFAFVSDSLGQDEVFAHSPFVPDFVNMSVHPGEDRNPELTQRILDFYTMRVYLIWESDRSGHKTIYYSTLDYLIGSTARNNPAQQIRISPNPSVGEASVSFECSRPASADIYTMQGKPVRHFEQIPINQGMAGLKWDGRDGNQNKCTAGNYLIRVWEGDQHFSAIIIRK